MIENSKINKITESVDDYKFIQNQNLIAQDNANYLTKSNYFKNKA